MRLQSHLESHYGIKVTASESSTLGVVLVRRSDGPRLGGPAVPGGPVDGGRPRRRRDAALPGGAGLSRRTPGRRPDPLSVLDGRSVLVTEYVEPVPAARAASGDQRFGGLRHLGALLGRLHALPLSPEAPGRDGGAWHHLADGAPAEEIAASIRLVTATAEGLRAEDRALCATCEAARLPRQRRRACRGRSSIRTSCMANVVASRERGPVLVDWTGAGRAARAWSLAFLLFAEGAKNLARIDLVICRLSGPYRARNDQGADLGEIDDDVVTVAKGTHKGLTFRQIELEFGDGHSPTEPNGYVVDAVVKKIRKAGARIEHVREIREVGRA